MRSGFDMRREAGTSDRASNFVYVSLCAVVVVEGIDDPNGTWNAKDTTGFCSYSLSAAVTLACTLLGLTMLHEILGRSAKACWENQRAWSIFRREV